ncbi:hypothetical protein BJX70DRAFT_396928 [Aspergillus crustosus]
MKLTLFWASIALSASPAIAVATESVTSSPSTTSTAATSSCTASLITKLCDYPEPGPQFAVSSDGIEFCWEKCNNSPPCDFVIFNQGNPYLNIGTCWLYPGETYDESKGSDDCGNPAYFVYDKPECSGGNPTATVGACEATACPSAIASVCGYPAPGDCWDGCIASSGASHCLSLCAEADACSYAVFNPHNPSNSPYALGTCWMYPNGTYDADSASECSGEPEQFVYENICPKPSTLTSSASSSSSLMASASATLSSTGGENATTDSDDAEAGTKKQNAVTVPADDSAPAALLLSTPLALGVAVLILRAL